MGKQLTLQDLIVICEMDKLKKDKKKEDERILRHRGNRNMRR
jgi:hypothetical protein